MAIKNKSLKRKAESLTTLLEAAYAKSTLRKYKPAWEKWVSWADPFEEINSCPADPLYVAIYLNDLTNSFATEGALTAAILGIRWGHLNSGFDFPTDHQLVKLALEGGFAAFFRISEILQIQIKEITFDNFGATVFLPKSKTDQVREGPIQRDFPGDSRVLNEVQLAFHLVAECISEVIRDHMNVLPHWMFLIDNLIRAAVKRTIDDISKGRLM
ncbi:integrase/recombinase xerD homolog [Clytia hemisphaerica]|uniref:integrase/recombinase xerD homolog n=1 Tax=Clytia hemisphaerica TaxID=252671 RepID=UPI0034D535BC